MTETQSDQITFAPGELLESHPIEEPLIAGGVRCHGGFDADGNYVSPRTRKRVPAIAAWQRKHAATFGTGILDVPLDSWPSHYPNVAQSKFLIDQGIVRPMITTLTRVGTVEGFGGNIGRTALPDLQPYFEEDIRGTAMAHLTLGLYEAHGRDEAGYEDEGGHRQMWFAARDIAFDNPSTENEVARMLEMMGIPASAYGARARRASASSRARDEAPRQLPADIEPELEFQIARMIRLLFIELSAYRTFAWAEEVLSDADLVNGDGEAARLVSYIRRDERPHVEYLRTVLSEMRDRTLIGASGKRYAGREMIGTMWDRAMEQSIGQNRRQNRTMQLRAIEAELEGHAGRDALLEEYHALGDVRPGRDGDWVSHHDDQARQ